MAVLRPIKVVLTNYPEGQIEDMDAVNNPEDPGAGSRKVPFSRVIYIERDDFMENPPKKFFRLSPGNEVRLRYAYIIKCIEVIKNAAGEIIELHCTIDPETKSGSAQSARKVKGTIHWVSASHAISAEVRVYDRLFTVEDPGNDASDFRTLLNPKSLETVVNCKLEPSLAAAEPGKAYQFERVGYFNLDLESQAEKIVFNRTVSLRDSWAKEMQRLG